MIGADDFLPFVDDDELVGNAVVPADWLVLIVDDEPEVHQSTQLTLDGVQIFERGLRTISAYSAREAERIIAENSDIAIILLDVVMESPEAGLRLIDFIRNELKRDELRIILRTGQPGYAPELDVITRYDINDYRSKNEITQTRLIASLTSALRSYQQIRTINRSRKDLKMIIQATSDLMTREGLYQFVQGTMDQIDHLLGGQFEGLIAIEVEKGVSVDPDKVKIMAASGRFEHDLNHTLADFAADSIKEKIMYAIHHKQSLTEGNAHVLFFNGQHYHFLAYIELTAQENLQVEEIFDLFCSNVTLCSNNLALIEQLKKSAFFDQLTGLPNRLCLIKDIEAYLLDAVTEAKTLIMVDIDHFNILSETIGNEAADELLQRIARRIEQHYPGMSYRTSGDTFALFMNNERVDPQTILMMLGQPIEINHIHAPLSFTMGLASPDRMVGVSALSVLNGANIALKEAKNIKRGSFQWLTHELANDVHQKVNLLSELRNAISNNEFYLVLQPQVSLKDKVVQGFEALIRWKKPDGSVIPPSVFIPVAEKSGLILSLGLWVFRKACEHLIQLHQAGFTNVEVAINVSIAQLLELGFLSSIDQIILDTKVDASKLVVEITESLAMDSIDVIPRIISEIHARGMKVALDDFGTGYSSLSYLTSINVDKIKADRSFISCINENARNNVLASTIVKLGHQLSLEVVAEGVETQEQLEAIQQMGYDVVQGYFYAKPMTLDQTFEWLSNVTIL